MAYSLARQLPALTAGIAVGVILQEVLLTAMDVMNADHHLNHALIGRVSLDGMLLSVLACWWIGGVVAGLMSSLIGHSMTTGCIAGALLMIPALMMGQIALADAPSWAALFTITPLIGAAMGAWIADRLTRKQTDATANSQDSPDT
ncbi:MAG: hypothetical protein AAGH65_06700 [Pseudomonadota bacterium]